MSDGRIHRTPGMFSRIALVVVIGFVGMHVAGYFLYGHERMVANALTYATSQAQRAYELDLLLQTNPELLPLLQSDTFNMSRTGQPAVLPADRWPHSDEVRAAVRGALQDAGFSGDTNLVEMAFLGGPRPRFELVLPSSGGGYLHVMGKTPIGRGGYGSPAGFSTSLIVLLILGGVLFVTRRATRQMGRFAAAATALGEGRAGAPLPENVGSRELRRASAAFNGMQTKVAELLAERSQMLAGVSHDLRTLVTRLSLRAEGIEDDEQRRRAGLDIALMTDILDQALTFSKDEHTDEEYAAVDMDALLATAAAEFEPDRVEIDTSSAQHLVVRAQFTALKRLLTNLIGNAVKYGGHARLVLTADSLSIHDPGSGFSEAQTAEALKPYGRLQAARSQEVPGTGLGLAIADNICRRHGWTLGFERTEHGFCVTVRFNAGTN